MVNFKHISLIFFLTSFLTLLLLGQLLEQRAASSQEDSAGTTVVPTPAPTPGPTRVLFCNKTSRSIDYAIRDDRGSTWGRGRRLSPRHCSTPITLGQGGTLYFFVNGNQIKKNVGIGDYCYVYNKSGFREVGCPPNF
jgi:hypothetical protein